MDWYRKSRRDLPWRNTTDPYCLWISEVMLQQTQAETVIPYYKRFIGQFPDVRCLAAANLSAVLKAWEGLGYYARVRYLHRAARIIVQDYGGHLPANNMDLKKIPGIGDYTAAAIASIAFGQPVPVLDGNARRVLARWIALRHNPRSRAGESILREAAQTFLERKHPGDWNQAVMEMGATLCTPKNPHCDVCPVSADCKAHSLNLTTEIPVRKPRKPVPHYHVTAGLIWHNDVLLIARRKEKGLLGGLWEFPGGKQEDGETLPDCLQRELAEELAISVDVGEEVCQVEHAYSHFSITLHVFRCCYLSGPPRAKGCAEWKWVKPRNLDRYAFPKADRCVIEMLLAEKAH